MLDLYLLLRAMWSRIGLGSQFPAVCIMTLYSLMAHQTWGVRRKKVQGPFSQSSNILSHLSMDFPDQAYFKLEVLCVLKKKLIKKIPNLDDVPIDQGCSLIVVALTQ